MLNFIVIQGLSSFISENYQNAFFFIYFRICIEFKRLEKTLLTVPSTAKEMVQLVEFVQNLKGTDFDILLEKVEVIYFIFSNHFFN